MQVVYLLLKALINITPSYRTSEYNYSPIPDLFFNDNDLVNRELKNVFDDFACSEEMQLNITDLFSEKFFLLLTKVVIDEFLNACKNTFGNLERILDRNPKIHIKDEIFSFNVKLKERKIIGSIEKKNVTLQKLETVIGVAKDFNNRLFNIKHQDQLEIYLHCNDVNRSIVVFVQSVWETLFRWNQDIRASFDNVYFLPASRTGIYNGMSSIGPILAELSKNRAYINKKIELPRVSEPISDYFISLNTNMDLLSNELEEIYSRIEKKILKGNVTYDKEKNILIYKPFSSELQLEMTEVSSMVSEISPIVAFLKYKLPSQLKSENEKRGKAILFIEEPEAHLHPSNQVALVEVFAELINSNVKLIMSSHSNYVFVKLNNMVLSKQLGYQRYQPIILNETSEGSVSKKLKIDELGAWDENFTDVSESLYEEREEIIDKMNTREE
jgi:predicted ATPase